MWPFRRVESFAVEMQDGEYLFFEANRVRIRRGRLEFLSSWRTLEAAVEAGEWVWVGAGLTRDTIRTEQ